MEKEPKDPTGLNRRDFARLAMAALGGALAGAGAVQAAEAENKKTTKKSPFLFEPHVCRGLNTCKAKGKGGKNDCAGTSACATAKTHTCAGDNECRGLGGCHGTQGENACKGKGGCHVPLSTKPWAQARKRFEEVMKKAGKKVGPAPAKK